MLVGSGLLAAVVGFGFSPTVVTRFVLNDPITPSSNFLSAGDYVYAQRWLTNEQLDSVGAGFVREGGGNWPCLADPRTCAKLNPIAVPSLQGETVDLERLREATVRSFLSRPDRVLAVKAPIMLRAHASLPGASVDSFSRSAVAFWLATLFLLAATLRDVRLFDARILALGTIVSFVFVPYAVLFFIHVETRYLLPIAFAIWTLFALAPPPTNLRPDARTLPLNAR